jgi:hypothetical protein
MMNGQEIMKTNSFFGKLPIEQEKQLAKEIWEHTTQAYGRAFFPFMVFDKNIVIYNLREAKRKLGELI